MKNKIYILTVKDYNWPEDTKRLKQASFDESKLYRMIDELEDDPDYTECEFNVETVYIV